MYYDMCVFRFVFETTSSSRIVTENFVVNTLLYYSCILNLYTLAFQNQGPLRIYLLTVESRYIRIIRKPSKYHNIVVFYWYPHNFNIEVRQLHATRDCRLVYIDISSLEGPRGEINLMCHI